MATTDSHVWQGRPWTNGGAVVVAALVAALIAFGMHVAATDSPTRIDAPVQSSSLRPAKRLSPPPPPPLTPTVLVPGRHQAALTFDDGPTAYTDQILDILGTRGVKATFFPAGVHISERPSTLRRVATEGHSVQNHLWSHTALTSLSAGGIQTELQRAAQAITSVGAPWPTCYRPPYRATDSRVRAAAAAIGFQEITWNVDTEDYLRPSPWTITQRALASADGRGLIILLHDGGGNRANTVAALPAIIDGLRARGYQFVRLCN